MAKIPIGNLAEEKNLRQIEHRDAEVPAPSKPPPEINHDEELTPSRQPPRIKHDKGLAPSILLSKPPPQITPAEELAPIPNKVPAHSNPPVIKPAAKGYRWVPDTPSSSSSSSAIHRVVCFRTRRIEGDYDRHGSINSRFYFVDVNFLLSAPPPPEAALFHHLPIARKPPYRSYPIPVYWSHAWSPDVPSQLSSTVSACAYVKPNLYILGGSDGKGSSIADVYSLDVSWLSKFFYPSTIPYNSKISDSWKICSRMTCPVPTPQAVVVDEKIYVFGWGARVADEKMKKNNTDVVPPMPFVEVYNTTDDEWESIVVSDLRFHRVEPILGVLSGGPDHSKHILFQPSCESELYSYSIADKTLSHHHRFKPFHNVRNESVVIDGILYSSQQCNKAEDTDIVGYSLNLYNHRWVPIPVLGLTPHLPLPLPDVHLVGLGDGMLCVVWTDVELYKGRKKDDVTVFMTTFKMFKLERNPQTCRRNEPSILLQASHISSRGFLVPGMYPLLNCLVIELPEQPSPEARKEGIDNAAAAGHKHGRDSG